MQPVQSRSKKFMWVTTALISLLLISNVAWGWMYTEGRNDMQQQLDSANKKLDEKQSRSQTKEKVATTASKAIESRTNTTKYREIPELGVKYEVNDQTKDFIYGYAGDNHIRVSTLTLANSPDNCSPAAGPDENGDWIRSVGGIARYPSDLSTSVGPGVTLADIVSNDNVKKVGNYYYFFTHNQDDTCSKSSDKSAYNAANAVVRSLQPIN